jgi:hypothetical protein
MDQAYLQRSLNDFEYRVKTMNKPIDEPLYTHRSPADRRRGVVQVLEEHPEYSDRRIARLADVSRGWVSEIRRELVRKSQIPSHSALSRVGADGKLYKRLPQRKQADATTP